MSFKICRGSTRTDAKAYSVYCFLFAQVLDWLAEFLGLFGGHKGGCASASLVLLSLWKAQARKIRPSTYIMNQEF